MNSQVGWPILVDHYSVFALTQIAHSRLTCKERLKAFPLQIFQQSNGWDVGVSAT